MYIASWLYSAFQLPSDLRVNPHVYMCGCRHSYFGFSSVDVQEFLMTKNLSQIATDLSPPEAHHWLFDLSVMPPAIFWASSPVSPVLLQRSADALISSIVWLTEVIVESTLCMNDLSLLGLLQ